MTNDYAKLFGKVAVLMGGTSAEREISLKSGAAVLSAMQSAGVDAHGVDVDRSVFSYLQQQHFDRAFIALHGRGGEDGSIQGGLQQIEMPYTGSGVLGSSVCMNKVMAKKLWQANDIPTAKFVELKKHSNEKQRVNMMDYPCVVKPAHEGSSIGVTKVASQMQFKDALEEAQQYDEVVLVEQWIDGQEYTASILHEQVLPIIRLSTPREFYDFRAKYQATDTQYHCPCGLSNEEERVMGKLAYNAFTVTGASGWGRVDFIIDRENQPWFLEVNTVPGMTDHSLVPMAAKARGMNFEQLVIEILRTSLPNAVHK